MFFRYNILFLFFVLFTFSSAENIAKTREKKIDSLKTQLAGNTQNLTYQDKIHLLHQLLDLSIINDKDESLDYAKQLLLEATEENDVINRIFALNFLGRIHYYLGSYNKSLEFYLQSVRLGEYEINDYDRAALYQEIAEVYIRLLDYKAAKKFLINTQKIYEKEGDRLKVGEIYLRLGTLQKLQKKHDKAKVNLLEALAIFQNLKNKKYQGLVYATLGKVELDRNQHKPAKKYIQEAIKIHKDLKQYNTLSNDYNDLGFIYKEEGNFEQALKYNTLAYENRVKYGRKEPIGSSLRNIAVLYIEQKKYTKADAFLKRSLRVLENLPTKEAEWLIQQIWFNYYEIYSQKRQFQKALEAYLKYEKFKYKTQEKKHNKEVAKLRVQFDFASYEADLDFHKKMIGKASQEKNMLTFLLILVVFMLAIMVWLYFVIRKKNNKLKEFNVKLEAEVQTRTEKYKNANRELANEIEERKNAEKDFHKLEQQLAQSQKMEAIGTLAGGIAHDFNNILSIILGYTQYLMKDMGETNPYYVFVTEIETASYRAKSLIEGILTYSRRSEPKKKPFKVNLLLEEALQLLRPSIPATMEVEKHFNCESITLIDQTKLSQVIMNLCTNAMYAMNNEGKLIISSEDVSAEDIPSDVIKDKIAKQYICISIQDYGHGIPKQTMQRIFEPYFTTKIKGDGTGMGLSIVHGIIEDYDGGISVESTVGKGTTFRVYLPAYLLQSFNQKKTIEHFSEHKKYSLVVVDDEASIVTLSVRAYKKLGYDITGFTDSIKAKEYILENANSIDVVITDQTMPKLVGTELAKEIWKKNPDIKIILCTGYLDADIPKEFDNKKNFRLFFKPVDINQISSYIQKFFLKQNL